MNDKDYSAAVQALLRWFENQDISLGDAVPVAGGAAISIILMLAQLGDTDPRGGLDAFIDGLKEQLKAATA